MRLALILSILFWLGVCNIAFGDYLLPIQPVKLNIVAVSGKNGISRDMAVKLRSRIKSYYRRYGIVVKFGFFIVRRDPFPYFREECNNVFCIEQEYSAYWHKFGYLRKDGEVLHVIAPPVKVDGHLYIGGMASNCGGFSYSNAETYNSNGEYRFIHSVNAAIHEIGHALGADHDDSGVNVMHSNASAYVKKSPLPMNKAAISEILGCWGS